MPTEPKSYYRTVVQVEVLSDEPVGDPGDLASLAYTDGGWSAEVRCTVNNQQVNDVTMAALLRAQGSDPSFLIPDYEEDPR